MGILIQTSNIIPLEQLMLNQSGASGWTPQQLLGQNQFEDTEVCCH